MKGIASRPSPGPELGGQGQVETKSNDADTASPNDIFADMSAHRMSDSAVEKPVNVFENLAEHRIDLDDDGDIADDVLTAAPVRRPSKKEYFRTHPSDGYTLTAYIYEDDETGDNYYVMPALRPLMAGDGGAKLVTLVLCVNRRSVLFFWPITTTTVGEWRDTAMLIAQHGRTKWVKAIPDKGISGYRLKVAKADYGEPNWSDHTLPELLNIAFRGRIIDSLEHPLAKDA
jgi:hypothetical protein